MTADGSGGIFPRMVPFIVLAASSLLFRALGALAIPSFRSSVTSLRWALSVMFLVTAAAHFGARRPDLVRTVPPSFPEAELLVTLTGVAELLGAAGLLVPRLAPWAAAGLALLLVAMFPANVHGARHRRRDRPRVRPRGSDGVPRRLRSAGSPDTPDVQETFKHHAEAEGVTLERFMAHAGSGTLLGRLPTSAEVANVATLMASDGTSAMTGTFVNVTCGSRAD